MSETTTVIINRRRVWWFLYRNNDIKNIVYSFFFGTRDYQLEQKYDSFYRNIKWKVLSKHADNCYKTPWIEIKELVKEYKNLIE